jgi:hypothetical protein
MNSIGYYVGNRSDIHVREISLRESPDIKRVALTVTRASMAAANGLFEDPDDDGLDVERLLNKYFRSFILFPPTRDGWRDAYRTARRLKVHGFAGLVDVSNLTVYPAPTVKILDRAV